MDRRARSPPPSALLANSINLIHLACVQSWRWGGFRGKGSSGKTPSRLRVIPASRISLCCPCKTALHEHGVLELGIPLLELPVVISKIIFQTSCMYKQSNPTSIYVQNLFPVESLQSTPLAVKLSHSFDDLAEHLEVQHPAVPCFIVSAALCPRHCIATGRNFSGQRVDDWEG